MSKFLTVFSVLLFSLNSIATEIYIIDPWSKGGLANQSQMVAAEGLSKLGYTVKVETFTGNCKGAEDWVKNNQSKQILIWNWTPTFHNAVIDPKTAKCTFDLLPTDLIGGFFRMGYNLCHLKKNNFSINTLISDNQKVASGSPIMFHHFVSERILSSLKANSKVIKYPNTVTAFRGLISEDTEWMTTVEHKALLDKDVNCELSTYSTDELKEINKKTGQSMKSLAMYSTDFMATYKVDFLFFGKNILNKDKLRKDLSAALKSDPVFADLPFIKTDLLSTSPSLSNEVKHFSDSVAAIKVLK